MLVVGAVVCHGPAFVAPGRASALAPPRAAAVRLESEMEYLKRRAEVRPSAGADVNKAPTNNQPNPPTQPNPPNQTH